MKLLLFIILCVAHHATASSAKEINWSTLTKSKLEDLPNSAFTSITAEQLGSIPPNACPGFDDDQIGSINVTAGSGFTADQLTQITSSIACGGFPPALISFILPAAITGFQPKCVSWMEDDAFSMLHADQLAALSPAVIAKLDDSQIENLSIESGAGWTATLLAAVDDGYGTCGGFQPAHVAQMPPAAFAGWTEKCVENLADDAWSQITPQQLSQLTTSAVTGMGDGLVGLLSNASGAGWTPELLSSVTTAIYSGGCAGFAPAHVATMTPTAFTGWTAKCVKVLPDNAWAMINANQLAQLSSAVVNAMQSDLIGNLGIASAAGWTPTQLSEVSTTTYTGGCSGFVSDYVAAMVPTAFSGWTADCIQSLADDAFSEISAQQLGNLSPNAVSGMFDDLIANLPADSGAGWTAELLGNVSYSKYDSGCTGFAPEHVANILPTVFSAWSKGCLANLPPDAFSLISATQLNNISIASAFGFDYSVVAGINPPASAGWTADLLRSMGSNTSPLGGCSGFIPTQIPYITLDAFAGFTSDCTSSFNTNVFSEISPAQVSALTLDAVTGLSAYSLGNIPVASMAGFTTDNIDGMTYCYVLSADQINNIKPDVLPGLDDYCFYTLNSTLVASFSVDQLNSFSVQTFVGFNAFDTISNDKLIAITIDRLSAISYLGLQKISVAQLLLLVNTFDTKITDAYTAAQLYTTWANHTEQQQFKDAVVNKVLYNSIPQPYYSTTWLQLCLTGPVEITTDMATQFRHTTIWGITDLQVPKISNDALVILAQNSTEYFLPQTVSSMTCDQLGKITAYYKEFSSDTKAVYVQKATDVCKIDIDAVDKKNGLTNGQIAGIVVGGVCFVAIVVGMIVFFVKRRKRVQYQAV